MSIKTFEEVSENYDLEIDRVIDVIRREKVKRILLQFPEGLKPYAQSVCDEVSSRCGCDCFIWMDSCFGACDVPIVNGVDLVVQFGHSNWSYSKGDGVEVV